MLRIVLERRDAITIGCGPDSWDISIDMTILKKLYPDTISQLIYFPDANCKGVWREDTIFFSQKYTECSTQREVLWFIQLILFIHVSFKAQI